MTGQTDDLNILFPDEPLVVDGEEITVRELRFAESLRLLPLLEPLIADLESALSPKPGEKADLSEILIAMGKHEEAVLEALAVSTGQDREWLDTLNDADGENLLLTWWEVNIGFFVRRVAGRRVARHAIDQKAQAAAGGRSSPGSSGTDTTRSDSETTPSGS